MGNTSEIDNHNGDGVVPDEKTLQQFASGTPFANLDRTILKLWGWKKGDPINIGYDNNTKKVIIAKR